MFSVRAVIKTLAIGTIGLSFVAVAETYYDQKFYSANFMNEVHEVTLDIKPGKETRIVASEPEQAPISKTHIMAIKNRKLIDGQWKLTRILQTEGERDNVVYDTFNNSKDKRSEVIMDFDLVGPGLVRLNKDNELIYNISLLTQNGTISLFKEYGEGNEIIEARMVSHKKAQVKKKDKNAELQEKIDSEKKNKFHIEQDLYLVSAVDPKSNAGVLRGHLLEGYAYMKNGELIIESVQLHIGQAEQTEQVSTEARVKAHGTFNDERGNQGIITLTNKQEIKVRFSTGKLEGILLNFATYDRKQEIENKISEAQNQAPLQADDTQERRETGQAEEASFMAEEESFEQAESGAYEEEYEEEYQEEYDQVEYANNEKRDIYQDEYSQNFEGQYEDEYERELYNEDYQEESEDDYAQNYDENFEEDYESDYEDEVVSAEALNEEERSPASVTESAGFNF